MTETTLQRADARLYDVLDVQRVDGGLNRVSDVAALRVGLIDAQDAQAVKDKLRALEPQALADALHDMLDVDLFKLFAGAWRQLHRVKQAVQKSVGPPPSDQSVDLPRHEVAGKLKPRLVLSLAGVDFADIDFEIKLAAAIQSAKLTLHGGALTAVRFGDVKATIKLACEGTEIREYARDLKLLSDYRFAHPIKLN
jgi:hypothetical protein